MNDLFTGIESPDFDISCAGPAWPGAFCFGGENGGVRFIGEKWERLFSMDHAVQSGEAINGTAFLGHFFAASSRDDVWIWTLPRGVGKKVFGAHFPVGAHGVIATTNGMFAAPLGLQGIMLCRPKEGEAQAVTITGGNSPVYVYRLASQQAKDGQHLLVCALRGKGVGLVEIADDEGNKTLHTKTFEGLDVVDVCTVGSQRDSASAVALGKEGTLILFNDVRVADKPQTIKYKSFEGTAYRVLAVGDYLIVLTSKALHVIGGIVGPLLAGKAPQPETPILTTPMEAVDAEAAHDRWVLVTMPHGLMWTDIGRIKAVPNMGALSWQSRRATTLSPTWRGEDVLGVGSRTASREAVAAN